MKTLSVQFIPQTLENFKPPLRSLTTSLASKLETLNNEGSTLRNNSDQESGLILRELKRNRNNCFYGEEICALLILQIGGGACLLLSFSSPGGPLNLLHNGEPEAVSPFSNPNAERPEFRLQIWRRRGAPPCVCVAGGFFRCQTPSRRSLSPPISSPAVDRVCPLEPIWVPGALEFRNETGGTPVGRRTCYGGHPLVSFRLGSILVSPSQRDETHVFLLTRLHSLDFGALELNWMDTLEIRFRKVVAGAKKDYYQKGTNII